VDRAAYGRAFGFERMMDTVGAIIGPATALALLPLFHYHYPSLFAVTLVPGLIAAALIAFAVKEEERLPVAHISFGEKWKALPGSFRRFLAAVGLFGAGDFAHTLLILLANQRLAPIHGASRAAAFAAGLYMFHNICYAASAFGAGWLADRMDKRLLLAGGYALAAVMGAGVLFLPPNLAAFAAIFGVGGLYVGIEEACEDSLCAELVGDEHHGMAFGVLATVNGVGDMLSSFLVGLLWTAFGLPAAFGYVIALSLAGSLLVLRSR
jgi:MFS family permease